MRGTVLVVDDDPHIWALLVDALAAEGYRPVAVGDGASALDVVSRTPPDLVITDVGLPGMDGLELLAALDAQGYGAIPTLVISAEDCPPVVPTTRFLAKPFELDTLLRAVEERLGACAHSA